jgi:hypothetical protein
LDEEVLNQKELAMTRSKILLAMLALAMIAGGPALAQAQRISLSIGGGYGHGYHGHHHHHSGVTFGYLAPPPRVTYVYPAPVVREQIYVYPQPAPVYVPAPAPQTPNWTTRAEPRTNALPAKAAANTWVVIRNPVDSGGRVAFLIDDETEVALDEGRSRAISGDRHTIEFDRGGDFGAARKTVGEGQYEFVVTERGWDLVSVAKNSDRVAAGVQKNELPR